MSEKLVKALRSLLLGWRHDAEVTLETLSGTHENVVTLNRMNNLAEGQLACADELEKVLDQEE